MTVPLLKRSGFYFRWYSLPILIVPAIYFYEISSDMDAIRSFLHEK